MRYIRNIAILVCSVFFIASVVIAAFNFYTWSQSVETQAVVVAAEEQDSLISKWQFTYRYLADGEEYQVSELVKTYKPYKAGDIVNILYTPAEPTRIVSPLDAFAYVGVAIASIALILKVNDYFKE